MKKMLCFLLSLIMIASMLSVAANAATTYTIKLDFAAAGSTIKAGNFELYNGDKQLVASDTFADGKISCKVTSNTAISDYSMTIHPYGKLSFDIIGIKYSSSLTISLTSTLRNGIGAKQISDASISGDLNHDNIVDITDLSIILSSVNYDVSTDKAGNEYADFDANSIIDINDLFILIDDYNLTPSVVLSINNTTPIVPIG